MEKERKVTKREMFERLIEIVENANIADTEINDVVEFLNHEIELVSKKRSGQTATQKANVELVEKIYDAMKEVNKPMTIGEIYELVRDVQGITSANKVSALVKKLKDTDRVIRTEDKKKAYFKVA